MRIFELEITLSAESALKMYTSSPLSKHHTGGGNAQAFLIHLAPSITVEEPLAALINFMVKEKRPRSPKQISMAIAHIGSAYTF
jgi:hypothetical protein